jgi:hypothetical protein
MRIVAGGGWAVVPAILIFILITNMRGDWYSKREHMVVVADCMELKSELAQATGVVATQADQLKRLTEIVETLTEVIKDGGRAPARRR